MTKPVYKTDRALVYEGDCLDYMRAMKGGIDAVLTDPPYGIGFAAQPTKWQRRAGKEPEAWDDTPGDTTALRLISKQQIIWGGNYYDLPPSRGWLCWFKPDAPPSMASIELAWTSIDMNARMMGHSISATNRERVGHPTQKPVAVMRWCLTFFKGCKIVLDPYAGSGTTGVAALREGIRCVLIEKEPKYIDMICRRLEAEEAAPGLFPNE